jgi:C4-dicarboxylate-specific signal transduction histidine kinase
MHEMAQPLSTIQASLELALLSPTTAGQYQEIAEATLRQLCAVVESMQFAARLTRFQQPAADVQDVRLSVALADVVSDLQLTLDSARIQLQIHPCEHEPALRISATRLRQMLFYMLQVVERRSQPGDRMQIDIQALESHLVLRLRQTPGENSLLDGAGLSPQAQADRALALAEAIVNSEGGEFGVTTNPLLIVANFPVKPENRAGEAGKNRVLDFSSSWPAAGSH